MANGYLGSEIPETSKSMQEVIPKSPEGWTEPYRLKSMQVLNSQDCTFVINEEASVFSYAGDGLYIGSDCPPITSLKIKESGIDYTWMGVY